VWQYWQASPDSQAAGSPHSSPDLTFGHGVDLKKILELVERCVLGLNCHNVISGRLLILTQVLITIKINCSHVQNNITCRTPEEHNIFVTFKYNFSEKYIFWYLKRRTLKGSISLNLIIFDEFCLIINGFL
jgi:hypothetical protein